MTIYILNAITIVLYSFMLRDDKKNYCFIVGLQLFLILALRNPLMGVDVDIYSRGYAYISNFSYSELTKRLRFLGDARLKYPFKFESGWTLLNWLCSKIGLSYTHFSIFLSLVNVFAFVRFIYKYSINPLISFLVLLSFQFYNYCFCILRQSLAVSLLIFSLDAILENKNAKAFFLILVAFCIHKVSIIFVPFLLFPRMTFDKKRMVLFFILLACELIVVGHFYKIIGVVLTFLGKGYSPSKLSINNLYILLVLFVLLIFIFFKNEKNKNNIFSILGIGMFYATAIETIGLVQNVAARAVELPLISLLIMLPVLIEKSVESPKIKYEIIIVCEILLICFMIHNLNNSYLIPYITIL